MHSYLLSASPSTFFSFNEKREHRKPIQVDTHVRRSTSDVSRSIGSNSWIDGNSVSVGSLNSGNNNLYAYSLSSEAAPKTGIFQNNKYNEELVTVGFDETVSAEPFNIENANNSIVDFNIAKKKNPGLLSKKLAESTIESDKKQDLKNYHDELLQQNTWDLDILQEKHEVFKSRIVTSAYNLAMSAHSGQYRKNGEPALAHCTETAMILANLNADETTVSAALLHDVLDDTPLSLEALKNNMPYGVTDLVKKVSKLSHTSQIVRDNGESMDNKEYKKIKDVLIASVDCRAVLIKLADRVHNMRTINALSKSRQEKWAKETLDVFVPLASRLGCWTLKSELEDLSFKIAYPDEYAKLRPEYEKALKNVNGSKLDTVLETLKSALDEAGIEYEDISGRPKNLYGVYKKMVKKQYKEVDEVLDLLALRVVVRERNDCYAVLRVINSLWSSKQGRLKDYIRNPKENGYKSIHDVICINNTHFEIQIRTAKMHYIAEHGVAAHWRYKESDEEAISYFVQARTLWARYVLGWVYEIEDRKNRPDFRNDLEAQKTLTQWNSFCAFSTLNDNRYNNKKHHALEKPRYISEDSYCSPINILVRDNKGLRVYEIMPRTTLETFLLEHMETYGHHGTVKIPLINGLKVTPDTQLHFGDLIEFSKGYPLVNNQEKKEINYNEKIDIFAVHYAAGLVLETTAANDVTSSLNNEENNHGCLERT